LSFDLLHEKSRPRERLRKMTVIGWQQTFIKMLAFDPKRSLAI
jgi:hypothetical protein